MLIKGESIKYFSKQLGHAGIQLTADLYGHRCEETSISAMNKLAMRIAGVVPVEAMHRASGTHG